MEHDLPTILTLLSKSFVCFDKRELRDSKIYLELSPNFGKILPSLVMTTLLDLWLMTGTNIVFRIILFSHLVEDEGCEGGDVGGDPGLLTDFIPC